MKFQISIPIDELKALELAGVAHHTENSLKGLESFSLFGSHRTLLLDKPVGPIVKTLKRIKSECISRIKSNVGIDYDFSLAHQMVCQIYDDMNTVTLGCAIRERSKQYHDVRADSEQISKAVRIASDLFSNEEVDLRCQNEIA